MENWGSKDDKVSRRMWETVETKKGEVGMAEAKGRRKEERRGEEIKRKGRRKETKKQKTERRKNNRDKKDNRRMGDLGRGRRSEKAGSRKISQVDKSVWQETVKENAHQKSMEPCYRYEGRGRCIHC